MRKLSGQHDIRFCHFKELASQLFLPQPDIEGERV